MKMQKTSRVIVGVIAITTSIIVFLVPFAFIFLTSTKTVAEASQLAFTWPTEWALWENLVEVITLRDNLLVRAFLNSLIITVGSVTIMVIVGAMIGYVTQRRASRIGKVVNVMVLAGLIVPPAVVPTIWVLQGVGLFKTMPGLIMVTVTYGLSFCILLFRAFVAGIPRELDEAAIIDGAGPLRVFFQVILPLLRPVVVTVIVVQSVAVFNDFTGPLYFLPGERSATVQLTLFNFQSQSLNQYNLLFTNILLITIPPLVAYLFFSRQIVSGMTSGAIKA